MFVPDVNECVSQACQNGGVCHDQVNSYNCSCLAGYTGPQCQTGKTELHKITSVVIKATHISPLLQLNYLHL